MGPEVSAPLIPPDTSRCQAEKPTGDSFMTLGGRPGRRERCNAKPTMLATEKVAGEDGLKGSMTLCDECFAVMQKQCPDVATFTRIVETGT